MLISITEKCRMGCTHCMDVATPEGNDMTIETFEKAIEFLNKHSCPVGIITGGEPTENPLWLEMIEFALQNHKGVVGANITLATNGMNISGNQECQRRLLSLFEKYHSRFMIQITHVEKYYPIDVDFSDYFFQHPNVVICDQIEAIYPQGRAKENNLPYMSKGSKCFNLRSIVRQGKDLTNAIVLLAMSGRFCTPRVNWNGDIKLGESRLCPSVATIWDSDKFIVDKICDFRCHGCDIVNKQLDPKYLRAIGEM